MLTRWVIGAIIVTALYAGRAFLIPIALSVLLSFLLAPVVDLLRRMKVPRTPAVLLAVALALGAITITGTILVSQASTLSDDAPAYAQRITGRIERLRAVARDKLSFLPSSIGRAGQYAGTRNAHHLSEGSPAPPTENSAIPVEVRDPPPTPLQDLATMVAPALAPLETTLLVIVLAIFILFQRTDLRDRLIRLFGVHDLHQTGAALDDGAQRLSRYFLSQVAINGAFGLSIWVGLFAVGIPSPGLWAILAGLLRFVPYVGALIAAIGPLTLAAAVDPGWTTIIAVALIFALIEPLVGYVVEPLLYGRSTGLSPVTVVVAAVFWTWIWGALGLILSMPLTLMLVALGRHIPAFAFFDILFGDRPALSASEAFYHRALHRHVEEAIDQAEELLDHMFLDEYFDDVILQAFHLAATDMERRQVARDDLVAMAAAAISVVEAVARHADLLSEAPALSSGAPVAPHAAVAAQDARSCAVRVACIAGRGVFDAAVAKMLVILLQRRGWAVHHFDRSILDSDLQDLRLGEGDVLCIAGLFGERAQHRLARMQRVVATRSPGIRIVTAVCRGPIPDEVARDTGALAATLRAAVDSIGEVYRCGEKPRDP